MPFLLSSSLGAGLGKQTRKPLGAHQGRILMPMKKNMAVCNLELNYVSCIGNSTQLDLFTSMHHFIICVVSLLSFVSSLLCFTRQKESSPKIRELIVYSQMKRILRRWTASTSIKFGQNNDQTTASTDSERCTRTPNIGQR